MNENNQSWPPVRRASKKPKWQRMLRRYWPPIRFGLIILAFILVIVVLISCMTKNRDDDKKGGSSIAGNSGSEEPTLSAEQIRQQADTLMKEAAFIAAGYDYQKACTMLKSFAYYDQFPEMAEAVADYEALDQQLISYPKMDQITHVFFHSLIVEPSRSFDGEYTDDGYNLYMTTISEFNAMMQQMYDRGYVLVTPYDVAYEDENGNFVYGDIRLPEGKIPFIMSQDDLNYYGYMIGAKHSYGDEPIFVSPEGDGYAHRLVIGEDGYPTCEYMDKDGNVTTGDYDLVPVLEAFIQTHPDFAYHGARAVLGMTGYEGVFGYRTAPKYEATLGSERYQQEVEEAKKVAQCLRDHGWILASHSYGHPSYGLLTADRVNADSQKWEDTVQPVIGDTDIILYPNGSDVAGLEKYTFDNAKFSYLYEDGYRYFFNVDSSIAWCQLGDNYYRAGRRNLDGYRMYHNPELLDDLFDVSTVFDKERPTPVPSI